MSPSAEACLEFAKERTEWAENMRVQAEKARRDNDETSALFCEDKAKRHDQEAAIWRERAEKARVGA